MVIHLDLPHRPVHEDHYALRRAAADYAIPLVQNAQLARALIQALALKPELSVKVPVRPDGLISSPLVENMQAAGRTPSELAREMEKTLGQYVRSPTVNVIVTSFIGTYDAQIRVVGQAANPQALSYRAGMTLLDVMIAVGGLGKFASGNRAKIIRNIDGKSTEIKVKINRLLDGDVKSNVEMRPGDVLIFPESRF